MQPWSTGPRTSIPVIEVDNAGMFYVAPPASHRRSPSPLSLLHQLREEVLRLSPPAFRRRSPAPPASYRRRLEDTSSTFAGSRRTSPPAVDDPRRASGPDWLASSSPPASPRRRQEDISSTSAGFRHPSPPPASRRRSPTPPASQRRLLEK